MKPFASKRLMPMTRTLLALIALAAAAAMTPAVSASKKATVKPAETARAGGLECRQFVPDAGIVIKVPCPDQPAVNGKKEEAEAEREKSTCTRYIPGSRTTITVPCEEAVEESRPEPEPKRKSGRRAEGPSNGRGSTAVSDAAREAGRPQQAEPGAATPASVQGPVARKGGKTKCSALVERAQLGEASEGDLKLLKSEC